jgi:hypothetical protein
MLSGEQTRDQQVKIKLTNLSNAISQTVNTQLESFTDPEITHVMKNYSKFLSYNLLTDFEAVRQDRLKSSPFDSILNDYKNPL